MAAKLPTAACDSRFPLFGMHSSQVLNLCVRGPVLSRASCLHEAFCQWAPSSDVAPDERGKSGWRYGHALDAFGGQPLQSLTGIERTADLLIHALRDRGRQSRRRRDSEPSADNKI